MLIVSMIHIRRKSGKGEGRHAKGAYEKLHFRNLLIYFLHKLYDEVHQLMLQHLFCMKVRN